MFDVPPLRSAIKLYSFIRPRCARIISALAMVSCLLIASLGNAAEAPHAMVAAEGDQAAQAGLDVLKRGGNAVDAAVAISLALGVTNSGSCGIGGGGFMLIYWARDHKFYALDYREVAPYAASPSMYIHDGKPDEELARSGPLAVAVPGEVAGLDSALRRFGTMKFSALAAPAVRLAENGFPLSPHMARDVAYAAAQIKRDPGFATTFFKPDGSPLKSGDIVHAKPLANLLRTLGDSPSQEFYRGKISKQIVAYMQAKDGLITEEDLAAYHPIWRDPLHFHYRGYDLYTMPPPSSGGVVLEMLGMLAPGHVEGLGFNSPAYLAQLIQIMRMGFIDRDSYADPAFVKVPLTELLSPSHLAQARKRALHGPATPPPSAAHDHGTSNFCVVDKAGNIADVTTTVNTIFGAKIMIPSLGLILNDEMDDFAIAPGVPNAFKLVQAKANEIEPGKRPLSSMSPLIALHHGAPALVVGGSGGPTIITGVEQVVLDLLDFQMEAQHAVAAPRIHHQAEPVTVFAEKDLDPKTIAALSQMGFQMKVVPELGAVTAIKISPGNLDGGFDPRKGGAAIGY